MNLEYCPPVASGIVFTQAICSQVDFEDFMLARLDFKLVPSMIHSQRSGAYERVCVRRLACASLCM